MVITCYIDGTRDDHVFYVFFFIGENFGRLAKKQNIKLKWPCTSHVL